MIKKSIFLLLLMTTIGSGATEKAQDLSLVQRSINGAQGAILTATAAYGTVLLGTFSHELGHGIVGAIPGKGFSIHSYSNPLNPFEMAYTAFGDYSGFNRLTRSAMLIAGPLAGIASSYGLLKLSNIYQEYKKTHTIKQALKDGCKKPIFNLDHNMGLLATAVCTIQQNLKNLIPDDFGTRGYSDGCSLIDCLFEGCSDTVKETAMTTWSYISTAALLGISSYMLYKTYQAHQSSKKTP
ncbi:MAG: hypothetical protein WC707_06680 [Candidatus Babeliaceae bacterium]|jgi:hypothetical protein